MLDSEAPPEPSAPPLIRRLEKDLERDFETETDRDERYLLDDGITPPPPPSSLILHEESPMSASPIYRTLFAMVALFGLLTLAARSDPERASEWLATLPVVGPRLTERPDLDRQITLRNVRGGYQSLRNARRGFVISGEAVQQLALRRRAHRGGSDALRQ